MKQLERKIIDSMYGYETRRTTISVILQIFTVVGSAIVIVTSLFLIVQEVRYQDGIPLLTLIIDDFETFRLYIFDVLYIVFYDFPKIVFVLFGFAIIVLGIGMYILVRNARTLRNRIISIIRHRKQKTG